MLFHSGDDLKKSAIDFINGNGAITLFSAYIKLHELKSINGSKKINRIIVRWEIEDLVKGVSDLELYNYCIENSITLYRNTRIHLKAFWDSENSILMGSANITSRGIGEKDNFNFELNAGITPISLRDINYLNFIINESEYVDEQLYLKLKDVIDSIELPSNEFPDLPTVKKEKDFFLISQLPQVSSPIEFYEFYSNWDNLPLKNQLLLSHDLVLFDIRQGLNESDFFDFLKLKFNTHPFIVAFKQAIVNSNPDNVNRKGTMNFGAVRMWFANNTTTVPTPRPFELTEYVQILYTWICFFDENFTWDVPGAHSQVIKYLELK